MKYCVFLLILLIVSCDNEQSKKIIYSYGGVSITRIDGERVSYFYYGDYSKQNVDSSSHFIKALYKRGTDVMNAYLVFEKGNKVRFIKMQDCFEEFKKDSLFYIYEFSENISFIHWENEVKKNPDNIIRIDDAVKIEKKFNENFKSKVKATYY